MRFLAFLYLAVQSNIWVKCEVFYSCLSHECSTIYISQENEGIVNMNMKERVDKLKTDIY